MKSQRLARMNSKNAKNGPLRTMSGHATGAGAGAAGSSTNANDSSGSNGGKHSLSIPTIDSGEQFMQSTTPSGLSSSGVSGVGGAYNSNSNNSNNEYLQVITSPKSRTEGIRPNRPSFSETFPSAKSSSQSRQSQSMNLGATSDLSALGGGGGVLNQAEREWMKEGEKDKGGEREREKMESNFNSNSSSSSNSKPNPFSNPNLATVAPALHQQHQHQQAVTGGPVRPAPSSEKKAPRITTSMSMDVAGGVGMMMDTIASERESEGSPEKQAQAQSNQNSNGNGSGGSNSKTRQSPAGKTKSPFTFPPEVFNRPVLGSPSPSPSPSPTPNTIPNSISSSSSAKSPSTKVFVPPISIEAIADKQYAHAYAAPSEKDSARSASSAGSAGSGVTGKGIEARGLEVLDEKKAKKNDKIISERLEEAKALDRNKRTAPGATMHKFSLWNKQPPTVAPQGGSPKNLLDPMEPSGNLGSPKNLLDPMEPGSPTSFLSLDPREPGSPKTLLDPMEHHSTSNHSSSKGKGKDKDKDKDTFGLGHHGVAAILGTPPSMSKQLNQKQPGQGQGQAPPAPLDLDKTPQMVHSRKGAGYEGRGSGGLKMAHSGGSGGRSRSGADVTPDGDREQNSDSGMGGNGNGMNINKNTNPQRHLFQDEAEPLEEGEVGEAVGANLGSGGLGLRFRSMVGTAAQSMRSSLQSESSDLEHTPTRGDGHGLALSPLASAATSTVQSDVNSNKNVPGSDRKLTKVSRAVQSNLHSQVRSGSTEQQQQQQQPRLGTTNSSESIEEAADSVINTGRSVHTGVSSAAEGVEEDEELQQQWHDNSGMNDFQVQTTGTGAGGARNPGRKVNKHPSGGIQGQGQAHEAAATNARVHDPYEEEEDRDMLAPLTERSGGLTERSAGSELSHNSEDYKGERGDREGGGEGDGDGMGMGCPGGDNRPNSREQVYNSSGGRQENIIFHDSLEGNNANNANNANNVTSTPALQLQVEIPSQPQGTQTAAGNGNSNGNGNHNLHTPTNGVVHDEGGQQPYSPLRWKRGALIGEGTFGKVYVNTWIWVMFRAMAIALLYCCHVPLLLVH